MYPVIHQCDSLYSWSVTYCTYSQLGYYRRASLVGTKRFLNCWQRLAVRSEDRRWARLCKYLAALLRGHPARVCDGYAPLLLRSRNVYYTVYACIITGMYTGITGADTGDQHVTGTEPILPVPSVTPVLLFSYWLKCAIPK